MYRVSLEKFEGPFELLLGLIDKKKLSINEVSLAEIGNQYLSHLEEIQRFPTKEVANFLVIASTLMLIKSHSLIPSLKLSNEEEMEIETLEEQLILYKQFRTLAQKLEKIFGKKIIFIREKFLQTEPVFIEPKDLSIKKIKTSLESLLNNLSQRLTINKKNLPETTIKKTVTLEQRINDLIKKMENKIAVCFQRENKECDKINLIINFLALLELTKRGLILVKQDRAFGDIEIIKHEA